MKNTTILVLYNIKATELVFVSFWDTCFPNFTTAPHNEFHWGRSNIHAGAESQKHQIWKQRKQSPPSLPVKQQCSV